MMGMEWAITVRGGFAHGKHPGDALVDLAYNLLDAACSHAHSDALELEPFFNKVKEDGRYEAMIQVHQQPPTGDLLIYIAGPMNSNPNYVGGVATGAQARKNIRLAIDVADQFAIRGATVFVPHLNKFWDIRHPRGFEFWLRQDENILRRCDLMVRLPGFSRGADREEAHAKKYGVQVVKLQHSAFPLKDNMVRYIMDAVKLNQFAQIASKR